MASTASTWRDGDGIHIDVRGLDPPQPMVAILTAIDRADAGDVIIAHLDRDPIYLYPELAERGWEHERILSDSNEVRLRLTQANTKAQ